MKLNTISQVEEAFKNNKGVYAFKAGQIKMKVGNRAAWVMKCSCCGTNKISRFYAVRTNDGMKGFDLPCLMELYELETLV